MATLEINKDKAMELANLVLLAYGMYEDFKEKTILQNENQWRFSPDLFGSIERKYDYHNQHYRPLNGDPIEYQVLAEFWHTDKPVGKLQLETVPFGFIASKKKKHGQESQPDEIYIVFRGTLNSQEWAENARLKKAEVCKGVKGSGYVHRGFNSIFETSYTERLKSLRGLYTSIKRRVLQLQPPQETRHPSIRETLESIIFNTDIVSPDAKIYITGHSLGGALALLAGRVIANTGRLVVDGCNNNNQTTDDGKISAKNPYNDSLAICTFAAPRVGDSAFKTVFQDINAVRYVNSEDIVPTVPPATSKLLGADMNLTPEGLKSYKSSGISSITSIYQATAGSVQTGLGKDEQTPFTHVGEQRVFTLSQDSISFNHNHQVTYRDGIVLFHNKKS
jgi:hypothetical protein